MWAGLGTGSELCQEMTNRKKNKPENKKNLPRRGTLVLTTFPLLALTATVFLATATIIEDTANIDKYWDCTCLDEQPVDIFPPDESEQIIRLVFLGDISISRQIAEGLAEGGQDNDYLLGLRQLSMDADATFANLECVLCDDELPAMDKGPLGGDFHLTGGTSSAKSLADAGLCWVSLANNHTMDYGSAGLLSTIDALDAVGILHAGAAENLDKAREPAILEIKGTKIALLAYTNILHGGGVAKQDQPGAVLFTKERVLEDIAQVRPECDLLIVSVHWMGEDQAKPDATTTSWAHSFLSAGADIIIGHHPHVLSTVEVCPQGIIAYSLGNAVFDTIFEHRRKSAGLVVDYKKDEGIISYELVPLVIEDLTTKISDTTEMIEFTQSKILDNSHIQVSQ